MASNERGSPSPVLDAHNNNQEKTDAPVEYEQELKALEKLLQPPRTRNDRDQARELLAKIGWKCDSVSNADNSARWFYISPERIKHDSLSNVYGDLFLGKKGKKTAMAGTKRQIPMPSPILDEDNNREHGRTDGERPVPSRSILSWLIDEKKVLNGAKIYLAGKDHATIVKRGQVSRAGIKCDCCQSLYSITEFDAHAKGSGDNPYANLFLEPDCTRNLTKSLRELICKSHRGLFKGENDSVCSVCHFGADTHKLTSCSGCSSSFHGSCLKPKGDPSAGDWYCPFCCCGVCGMLQVTNDNMIYCHQCEHYYHEGCRENGETICSLKSCATVTSRNGIGTIPKERWFCSKSCAKIYNGLRNHIGKRNMTKKDGSTWTLIKPIEYDYVQEMKDSHIDSWAVTYSKIFVALQLLQSSIKPIKQLWPGRDLVTDAVLSRGSELKRLNFSGTYTVLLEQKDELISVAVIRVFGEEVAEILLVATRPIFQMDKNCRTLLEAIEKLLFDELGVKRLVLPSTPDTVNMWTAKFRFSTMSDAKRSELSSYAFLNLSGPLLYKRSRRFRENLEQAPGSRRE